MKGGSPACALVLAVVAIFAPTMASAAGGAHVVDDSQVETVGVCHLESWETTGSDGATLVNLSPACTFRRVPNLEVGGFLSLAEGPSGTAATIGLAPKFNLRSEAKGIGLALSGNLGFDGRSGRPESAAMIVPVTIPASAAIRVNLNGGWVWSRGTGHEAFAGVQAEIALRRNLGFMVEVFDRSRGRAGAQAGFRWTVARGRIDLDLLTSRYGDGQTRQAITFGLTVRR